MQTLLLIRPPGERTPIPRRADACRTLLVGVLLVVASCWTHGATVFVSPTGTHTQPYGDWASASTNIQIAVDYASNGDTVRVEQATYRLTDQVTITNGVTLTGDDEFNWPELVGGGWGCGYRAIEIAHPDAVVAWFTIYDFDPRPEDGGCVLFSSPGELLGCAMWDGFATNGGSVMVSPGAAGAHIEGCGFYGSWAVEKGGSIYAMTTCLVERCRFPSGRTGGSGGAIYGGNGLTVRSCEFMDGRAAGGEGTGGGAMYLEDGSVVENCTVWGSRAYGTLGGGGIYCETNVLIRNTIIWGNTADTNANVNNPGGGTDFAYCCSSPLLPGPGNIDQDPVFADEEQWNLELAPGSPCLDSGTNQPWMVGARDVWGYNQRIEHGVVDLGASETRYMCHFNGSPRDGFDSLTVVFTGSVYEADGGTTTNWLWDFEDDGTFDIVGPDRTVVTNTFGPGMHTVHLQVQNDIGWSPDLRRYDYIRVSPTHMYVSLEGSHEEPFDTWATAANDIQSALNVASDGVTIHVTNGTWYVHPDEWQMLVDKGVRLLGENGPEHTFLDGENAKWGIAVEHPDAVVEGFTITRMLDYALQIYPAGGTARDCVIEGNPVGGNLAVWLYGSGIMDDCIIRSNAPKAGVQVSGGSMLLNSTVEANGFGASYSGGGVYCTTGATVSNCTIRGNGSPEGAGAMCESGGRLIDCRIEGNEATENGGGVVCEGGQVVRCTVSGNVAAQYGGGLIVRLGGTIDGCTITGNTATNGGGGAWIDEVDLVVGSTFASNTAYEGGGIVTSDGSGTIRDCRVTENMAQTGGGIHGAALGDYHFQNLLVAMNQATYGGGLYLGDGTTVENCTVVSNTASSSYGGLYDSLGTTVRNTIIYLNHADHYPNHIEEGTFDHCCAEPLPAGTGNTDADPRFVDPAAGDFRTRSFSPCRDGGTNQPWMATATDLDGANRIQGPSVDIGAYEGITGGMACAISGSPLRGRAPLSVTFTATVSNASPAATHFAWDVDHDGTVDQQGLGLDSPVHIYSSPGTYSVSLTVSNAPGNTDREVKYAYVEVLSATPETRYVSPGGSHTPPFLDWATAAHHIQSAVDLSYHGDTVMVSNATYAVSTNIVVTNGVTLRGVGDRDTVIIDGQETARCLLVDHPQAVVEGVTLTRGNAYAGGGLYLADGLITNCRILQCSAPMGGSGGGVFAEAGLVIDCSIVSNSANYGGGGWLTGTVAMVESVIEDNDASGNGGGLVMLANTTASNCVVRGNITTPTGLGGGVYATSSARLDRCIVSGNSSTRRGGGLNLADTVLVRNCLVVSNMIEGAGVGSGGAGIYGESGAVRIESCTVAHNDAGSAYFGGGGVGSRATIANSIIWGNTADTNANYDPLLITFHHSCTTPLPVGDGNLDVDPLLDGDFRIDGHSPCFNAGSNQNWMASGADLAGMPRLAYGQVDMGAYEYDGAWLSCSFTGTPTNGLMPLTVDFTSLVEGTDLGGLVYRWDFDGDGAWDRQGSAYASPSHTYTALGVYTVSLEVANAGASATMTRADYIEVDGYAVMRVSTNGASIYPYATWDNACTSLQQAVDDAWEDSTILVTNGIYYLPETLNINKRVTLQSVNGPDVTRITPHIPTAFRVMNLGAGGAVVDGFMIWYGKAWITGSDGKAGGIYCSASALVKNCIITQCSADHEGGGVLAIFGATLENCTIWGCDARQGGGVYLASGATVRDCEIYDCDAWASQVVDRGGGAYLEGGLLENCLVRDCSAFNGGSGVFAYNGTVQNCTIVSNRRYNAGAPEPGGLGVRDAATVRNCIVVSNAADDIYFYPGSSGWTIEHICTGPAEPNLGSTHITLEPQLITSAAGPYRLSASSPCVDTGTATGAPDHDMDGLPRPLDGPDADVLLEYDMGAFEYAPLTLDSDGDGLSDLDEVLIHGCDPLLPDTDGDGLNDYVEVVAGSSPSNAGDVFRVSGGAPAPGGGFAMSWQSHPGRLYTIRTTTDLRTVFGDVPTFIDVPATGGIMTYTHTAPVALGQYFVLTVRLAE